MLDTADPDQSRSVERLQQAEYAYLTTVRPDGRPHTVPVCYLWEGESILIFSIPNSVKTRNLKQNQHVSLAVDNFGDSEYFSVVIEGTAALADEPGLDMNYQPYAIKYKALSERIFGTSIPPAEFIAQYSQVVRITPTNIRHDA